MNNNAEMRGPPIFADAATLLSIRLVRAEYISYLLYVGGYL